MLGTDADDAVRSLIRSCALPFGDIAHADVDAFLDDVGAARVVLIGEASHGTSEFYLMRAHLTRALIERRGFTVVAVEGDYPDCSVVDAWVRHRPAPRLRDAPFARFPRWMWRNREVQRFAQWLRAHNDRRGAGDAVSFAGLDLYALFNSIGAVVDHLDAVSPPAAAVARARFACLEPWQHRLDLYGHAAEHGAIDDCEDDVVALLRELLARRLELGADDAAFDVVMNATLVRDAERYYRAMFRGRDASWNLRDRHMLDTLQALLAHRGPAARAVVWAHNSHVGDARASVDDRGEWTLGQLAREEFGDDDVRLVGCGTDHGTVAAASDWDGPLEIKAVRPSLPGSSERLFHDAGVAAFQLAVGRPFTPSLRDELARPRLQRAIGVIYRPQTERFSHYFATHLAAQYDWYLWFDGSHAVSALDDDEALVF